MDKILSNLINYQPNRCILSIIKITSKPMGKKIPRDLISEPLDLSQSLYLHGYGMEITLVPSVWDWIMTSWLWLTRQGFSSTFHYLPYYTTVVNIAFELLFSLLICFSKNISCKIHFLHLKALWGGTTLQICMVIFPVQCVFETAGWEGGT